MHSPSETGNLVQALASFEQRLDQLKSGLVGRMDDLERRLSSDSRNAEIDAETAAEFHTIRNRAIFRLDDRITAVTDQIADLGEMLEGRLAALADRLVAIEEVVEERIAGRPSHLPRDEAREPEHSRG